MSQRANRWKGTVVGLLGSVAGLIAMRYYQQHLWSDITEKAAADDNGASASDSDSPLATTDMYPDDLHLDSIALFGRQHNEQETSTAAIGRHLYTFTSGQPPRTEETKEILSYLTHWGYGMLQGGVYGAMRAGAGFPDLRGGLLHASALWLLGDELLVPLFGLQPGPTATPPIGHINRLGAHLFYGAATAAATQLLYRALPGGAADG